MIIISIVLSILFLAFTLKKKNNFGVYYICFIIFYSISHFTFFLNAPNDSFYNEDEMLAFIQAAIYLIVTILTYRLLSSFFKIKNSITLRQSYSKSISYILFIMFFLGLILYIINNGIAIGLSYNERLEANTGGGLAIILMYSYIPATVIYYRNNPNKKHLIISMGISLFCGLLYYIIIGGSRNVLAAGLFSLIYLAVKHKNISIKSLIIIIITGVFSLILLEAYRYSNNVEDSLNFIKDNSNIIYFIFESFSPMLAVININKALELNNISPQLLVTFFNEFSILIPRFLWENKPINVYNNGYYYTTNILNLNTNLTMSPTLLGSSLIMFGSYFYWVFAILSGIVLYFFDLLLVSRKNKNLQLILICSIGYLFFWVRDGLEVYLYVVIKFSISILIAVFITNFLISASKNKK
ncbi:WzyE family oligosaccharide polymerase [Providencia rettgeri]|nr:WzyE family oligosaccharide polymerase [Providencia rettgeri]ELR5127301.1 WzyE family oligosaccharide polymerase [Providencia rettgeri]ELS4585492.1 WzyE family oligosaccharide polymerase [Providencia rettgeri]